MSLNKLYDENPPKPNFVLIVTDAFDGRIVVYKTYEKVVKLTFFSEFTLDLDDSTVGHKRIQYNFFSCFEYFRILYE